MVFNSFSFMLFFPIVTLLYFLIPPKIRHLWLLAASYYFYMSWNPKYALLMFTSTLITFASGLLIDHASRTAKTERSRVFQRKMWVALSLLSNLSILFFFKYFNFAINSLNSVLGSAGIQLVQPAFDVILPVGISFYTFQALSYTIDIYRGDIYVERSLARYALFVSFFPQLVAGPIERSKNLLVQIHKPHKFDFDRARDGLSLMLWGLFLKLVLADRIAILVNQVYNNCDQYTGFYQLIATLFFGLQIYCDFGSYSLMAIGSAQVMGFKLMDNFRQPYFAKSIEEFWRRWHISLSTWFRDYLYIPLGGNRKGKLRKYMNLMIVFLTSGLWHGANWTFVMWGFLHGAFQVIGLLTRPAKLWLTDKLHINRTVFSYKLGQLFCTYLLVHFAWIFFRAATIQDAFTFIGRMFQEFNPWILFDGSLYTLGLTQKSFWIAIAAIGLLILVSIAKYKGVQIREKIAQQNIVFRWMIYFIAIFSIMIFGIYGPGYSASQFIYFQF